MTIKHIVTIFIVLLFATSLTFSSGVQEKEKGEIVYNFKALEKSFSMSKSIDVNREASKRLRYLNERKRKQETLNKHRRFPRFPARSVESGAALSHPLAVDIVPIEDTFYYTTDSSGNTILMGLCQNAGSTSAVFIEINCTFKNGSGGAVGTDSSYIYGGNNVKLASSGLYTNGLGAGQYGFFIVWTNIPYTSVSSVSYYFSWYTYGHGNAMASVDFVGNPGFGSNYNGNLMVGGTIKNSSFSYLTYFTQVYFAIFNSNDQVIDVDFTYVDGSSYNTGTVTTDTALYPGESGTFLNYFVLSTFSAAESYMNSFEWDEAAYSSPSEKDPPFGSFDTPLDGSTVASSIAVTGWALDDTGIDSIKLYRQDGNNLVYIGDALQVEGARPDVAAAYPGYPYNTKAGWGYMLLTNFLPGGGNGTFTLEVIAADQAGKTTSLGTKTIAVDNANATKPFGAIDTPAQGGTASGGSFVNWGWALTPQPKMIPIDGSTISVFVDGANIGHPAYNVYRSDIATLFSGYANSDGAIGYFKLDTTAYSGGVHTIQWTAKDNEGASDGIGSRYFTIANPRTTSNQASESLPHISDIMALPTDNKAVISFREGYGDGTKMRRAGKHRDGIVHISMPQSKRLVLQLNDRKEEGVTYDGYLLINGKLSGLPVGSTLDRATGTFYWMPGPAFRGRFPLVFVKTSANGNQCRQTVIVGI